MGVHRLVVVHSYEGTYIRTNLHMYHAVNAEIAVCEKFALVSMHINIHTYVCVYYIESNGNKCTYVDTYIRTYSTV